MFELFDAETLVKFDSKIFIGDKVIVGGYEYTKTSHTIYENNSSIIELCEGFVLSKFKKSNGYSTNGFGQKFKKNQF